MNSGDVNDSSRVICLTRLILPTVALLVNVNDSSRVICLTRLILPTVALLVNCCAADKECWPNVEFWSTPGKPSLRCANEVRPPELSSSTTQIKIKSLSYPPAPVQTMHTPVGKLAMNHEPRRMPMQAHWPKNHLTLMAHHFMIHSFHINI
jgi:hypothetical protein